MNITRKFSSWAVALFLAFPSQVFGLDTASLFAPAFPGDGQTANWRIIDKSAATHQPWTAVGNFLIPGLGGYCSAVLVAPRIVLTANHCLYALDYSKPDARGNPTQQLMDPTQFVFVAGVHDESFIDAIPVEAVITGGWAPGSEETAKDWVIAILARPASASIVPMAFKSYKPEAAVAAWSNKLVVAAYPAASFAFSSVLRFSFNCSILKSAANVVRHDCASQGGSSGGPILVEENGAMRLVGIHSSSQGAASGSKNGVSINSFLVPLEAAVARFETTLPVNVAVLR